MKKILLVSLFLFSSLIVFADLSNRGRLDYDHGEYEFLIPLIILLILGGVFIFYWSKDFWEKNKDEILATLSVFGKGAVILFVLFCVGRYILNNKTDEKQITPQQTEDSARQNLPDGFRPVNNINEVCSQTSGSNDSWASYPPVITDGSQMTNKANDFLVAAIINPSFNLHDYYRVLDMTPQNTQFLSFERYCRSKFIREHYSPVQFREVYDKVSRAWTVFCDLQGTNFNDTEIIKYMLEYNAFDTSKPRIEDASNPQLIKNLKIRPLYCN